MSAGRIAARYAKSLLELAVDEGKLDRVLEDIGEFIECLKNRDLHLMLKSPIIHSSKKIEIIQLIFQKAFDPLTLKFVEMITKKGREAFLPEIANEFIAQYNILKRISTVYLTSANPLSKELIQRIKKILESSDHTYEHIQLKTEVDPELIGGFVIEIGDKLYDASVKYKLDSLKKEFAASH